MLVFGQSGGAVESAPASYGMCGVDICFAYRLGKPAVVCNAFHNNINSPGMAEAKWVEQLEAGIETTVVLGAPTVMIPTPGVPG